MSQELYECLERTIQELQALSIIYEDDTRGIDAEDDDSAFACTSSSNSTNFKILTNDEFQEMQKLLEQQEKLCDTSLSRIPDLRVEINSTQLLDGVSEESYTIRLHVKIPKGYPTRASAIVSVISISNLNSTRNQRDAFATNLNAKAKELCDSGCEVLMELIQYVQDSASEYLHVNEQRSENELPNDAIADEKKSLSRRWIWVHHITNSNRCKDIVSEAQNNNLSGFLKRGYPGIVIVEGESTACDEYVQWIKGNKSRPGGFGRNWGHHVRGEESDVKKVFVNQFEDIGEDLASLAALCREAGMEDEFKLYVMQH